MAADDDKRTATAPVWGKDLEKWLADLARQLLAYMGLEGAGVMLSMLARRMDDIEIASKGHRQNLETLDAALGQRVDLGRGLERLELRVTEMVSRQDQRIAKLDQRTSKLETAVAKLDGLGAIDVRAISSLANEVHELRVEIAATNQRIDKETSRAVKVPFMMAPMIDGPPLGDRRIALIKELVKELELKLQRSDERHDELFKRCAELEHTNSDFRARVVRLVDERDLANRKLAALDLELNTERTNREKYRAKIAELEGGKAALERQLSELVLDRALSEDTP